MRAHFYSLETGLLTGGSFFGDPEFLEANTPAGHGAVEGITDWQSQRVDLKTGEPVNHQPPAPAADELRTWTWDADIKRWVDMPTLQAHRLARIAPVQGTIEALESAQARPMREVLAAMLAGTKPATESSDKLADIGARIAALQTIRSAMAAATTQVELDAVVWPAASRSAP